ncbi:hypothetical protein PoB_005109800 [Plakobranchus ocellatus]|uniref:Uncharacterized protein n=1 Tax=Plakobranchus ocellatus TaxID=259542 RepID=A0AAV4BY90_9GAST|nr:hypothetical protein PoB_005109800 [Plakobranchus ocellatus]
MEDAFRFAHFLGSHSDPSEGSPFRFADFMKGYIDPSTEVPFSFADSVRSYIDPPTGGPLRFADFMKSYIDPPTEGPFRFADSVRSNIDPLTEGPFRFADFMRSYIDTPTEGSVDGTVASQSALRSAGTLLSRVRAPPSAPRCECEYRQRIGAHPHRWQTVQALWLPEQQPAPSFICPQALDPPTVTVVLPHHTTRGS